MIIQITRAWRYENETDRIHYVEDGRHLYVDKGNPLYDVLESRLTTNDAPLPVEEVL